MSLHKKAYYLNWVKFTSNKMFFGGNVANRDALMEHFISDTKIWGLGIYLSPYQVIPEEKWSVECFVVDIHESGLQLEKDWSSYKQVATSQGFYLYKCSLKH